VRISIPFVDYRMHINERSTCFDRKPMRRVGFAPWDPNADDAADDEETFAQQRRRLRPALEMPDDPNDPPYENDDAAHVEPM
jgi:hypothetical protein